MNEIRLLPEAIANQIAAGEVVQRPASIVKELLENSVDAGATQISLIVKEAGRTLVQVLDNGKGMNATDAMMSFARHATSKITSVEDLFKIRSMGFRGEALASIASVAQVELRTRQDHAELGTCLVIEGSEVKRNESIATSIGTSIAVKNVFYNVPARRAFLKSNTVEMSHIMTEFSRVAMAHPGLAFTMVNGDSQVYKMSAGKLSQRIVDLLGANFKNQMAHCQEETDLVRIQGYIGKPEMSKKTRGEQFFFVNNRFVKHQYFHHAVLQAYDGLLSADMHPFYVLFLDINPAQIDVNVHPTKTELKFEYEKEIYAIIRAAVRKALSAYNLMPSLDFDSRSSLAQLLSQTTSRPTNSSSDSRSQGGFSPASQNSRQTANRNNWDKLYQDVPSRDSRIEQFLTESPSPLPVQNASAGLEDFLQPEPGKQMNIPSAANRGDVTSFLLMGEDSGVLQVQQKFIITAVKTGLMVVDQRAAHERILYEKMMNQMGKMRSGSQQKLFPKTIEVSPWEFDLLMKLQPEFAQYDFQYEAFGGHTIKLTALPVDLPAGEEAQAFHELLSQIQMDMPQTGPSFREMIARTLSRRSAIRWGVSLSALEMTDLIERLFSCELPHYTPSGSPTLTIISSDRLGSLFQGGVL